MPLLPFLLWLNAVLFAGTVTKLSSPDYWTREGASQTLQSWGGISLLPTLFSEGGTPEADERLDRHDAWWTRHYVPFTQWQVYAALESKLSDEWVLGHKEELAAYYKLFGPNNGPCSKSGVDDWIGHPPWIYGSEAKDLRHLLRSCVRVNYLKAKPLPVIPQQMEGPPDGLGR